MNKRLENYGILYHQSIASCAVAYTDFWTAYGLVFPRNRHRAVGKAKQRRQRGSPRRAMRPERR